MPLVLVLELLGPGLVPALVTFPDSVAAAPELDSGAVDWSVEVNLQVAKARASAVPTVDQTAAAVAAGVAVVVEELAVVWVEVEERCALGDSWQMAVVVGLTVVAMMWEVLDWRFDCGYFAASLLVALLWLVPVAELAVLAHGPAAAASVVVVGSGDAPASLLLGVADFPVAAMPFVAAVVEAVGAGAGLRDHFVPSIASLPPFAVGSCFAYSAWGFENSCPCHRPAAEALLNAAVGA